MSSATEQNGGEAAAAIAIGTRAASGYITLTRPAQLNALNDAMRASVAGALRGWIRSSEVYALLIESASPKVFSAGGDIRELAGLMASDPASAHRSLAAEYRLNWALECFAKPTVSLIDGLVVGSGVGLTQYGTHRVAGEGYRFAMPETAIGLFPDVGAASVLARLPDAVGIYLGLTGRQVGRADAYALGLATHCIARAEFAAIAAGLADAEPVDQLLDARHVDPGAGELAPLRHVIADTFSGGSVAEIMQRLAVLAGRNGSAAEWAGAVRTELSARSPLALAVTLEHFRRVGFESLRDTLMRDYRLACRMLAAPDFREGVRAMVVDKDKAPRWRPGEIEAVTAAEVEAIFAPLGAAGELVLATRESMQDLRASG